MENTGYIVYPDDDEGSVPYPPENEPRGEEREQSSSASRSPVSEGRNCSEGSKQKKKREPRLIYCGDGVITEDEVGKLFDELDEPLSKTVSKWTEGMDPKESSWPKWFGFYSVLILVHVIVVCEFFGEKLARFFGVMDSKYTYILDEHLRNIRRQKQIEDSLEMEPEIQLTSMEKTTNE